jgi:hypothetical protein
MINLLFSHDDEEFVFNSLSVFKVKEGVQQDDKDVELQEDKDVELQDDKDVELQEDKDVELQEDKDVELQDELKLLKELLEEQLPN